MAAVQGDGTARPPYRGLYRTRCMDRLGATEERVLMRPDELERRLRERLDSLGPAPRAELLHVLMLPDLELAERIGESGGHPEKRGSGSC
jgi:hypothetical protein